MPCPHMQKAVFTEHPVVAWSALTLRGRPEFPDLAPMQKHQVACQTTKKMIPDKSKNLKIKSWVGIVSMQRQQEISRHLIGGSSSPALTWPLVSSGITSPQGKFYYVCMSCPPEKNHAILGFTVKGRAAWLNLCWGFGRLLGFMSCSSNGWAESITGRAMAVWAHSCP